MPEIILPLIIGLIFIFLMTAIGALLTVIAPDRFFNEENFVISGISSGIMLSSAIFSLILPSLESSGNGIMKIIPTALGILFGGVFMVLLEKVFPSNSGESSDKLFVAITAHNIPEGITVGFAFGAVISGEISLATAILLTFGIGIQNIPEGAVVSAVARKKYKKKKSLIFGLLSGVVEPIGGIIGFYLAEVLRGLLPYMMSFSAGAMIYCIFFETQDDNLKNAIKFAVGVIIGFIIMTSLDVMLG